MGEESTEDSIEWLRSRGIQVETPEDRKKEAESVREQKALKEGDPGTRVIKYVVLPTDHNTPCYEETVVLRDSRKGDQLESFFKQRFVGGKVDVEQLRQTARNSLIGNSEAGSVVSDKITPEVIESSGGSTEKFRLGEKEFLYLDGVGALKSLAPNKHASSVAGKCGFGEDVPFFGEMYLCRYNADAKRNEDFTLEDLKDEFWAKQAFEYSMQNMRLREDTGAESAEQIITKGGQEEGYSWTQNPEEVEVVVPLQDAAVKAKQVKVVFKRRSVVAKIGETQELKLDPLFSNVCADECTWTLADACLTITLPKESEGVVWGSVSRKD